AAFACCNIFIGYPFDTVKTRLQLQLHPDSKTCLKELARGGIPGLRTALYRGASLPLCALCCKQPFEFATFEYCSKSCTGTIFGPYLGGLLAGSVGAVIACPFNVGKIWMQSSPTTVQLPAVSPLLWRAFGFGGKEGAGAGGVPGGLSFAQGKKLYLPALKEAMKASLVFQVPFTTTFLGTYGALREAMPRHPLCTATAGATAALVTWAVVLPLDVLRTRVQAGAVTSVSQGMPPKTLLCELLSVVKAQGPKGLWTGWGPISIRAITASISMSVYERLKV
ncbi:unnamed protein product, partial [Polarella glacialis]